jgi:hypothetical protein
MILLLETKADYLGSFFILDDLSPEGPSPRKVDFYPHYAQIHFSKVDKAYLFATI